MKLIEHSGIIITAGLALSVVGMAVTVIGVVVPGAFMPGVFIIAAGLLATGAGGVLSAASSTRKSP